MANESKKLVQAHKKIYDEENKKIYKAETK